jgi:Fe-S cluster assembly protein SufD
MGAGGGDRRVTTTLDAQFASRIAAAVAPGPELELRHAALARFKAQGFPTRRQEEWKYTDLKPIAEGAFDLAPAAPDEARHAAAAERIAAAVPALGGPRLVFVDGHLVPELSSPAAELPVVLEPLAEHPEGTGVLAADAGEAHVLAALNAAFMLRGSYLRVPPGTRVDAPLAMIFVAGPASGVAPQPRVRIDLAANAELTVVQQFVDAGDPASWVNLVTETRQAAGSRLRLYRLQEHGAAQCHTSLLDARLERDARLSAVYVDLGGRLVRNDLDIKLDEPGAEAEIEGLFFAQSGQHIDDHLHVDHRAPHTRSIASFRGIAAAKGRGVFNGKVIVREGAQQIDARQSSDNLVLDRSAEIDTKPELEIYADDVKCAHGATVGELDEKQLFYLRARGVAEDAARALLTFAFANRVIERIGLTSLRDHVARRVARFLPNHDRWERLV